MKTFEEFSAANRARCEAADGFNHPLEAWSVSDWFLAITGELGEAANVAKKLNRVRDGIAGNKEAPDELLSKLRKELGDTFVYLDLIGHRLGFSILDAGIEVFNAKSAEIGYGQKPAQAFFVCEKCSMPRVCASEGHCDRKFNGYR